MDTQQWAIKMLAVCVGICIPLSVVGVVVLAVTHDGATIQLTFDYFQSLIQWAIPIVGAMTGLHIWTQRSTPASAPVAAPVEPAAPAPAADPSLDGTAGAV